MNIPKSAIKYAKDNNLCGEEAFSKQRLNSSDTLSGTNYLGTRSLIDFRNRILKNRGKRDTTITDGKANNNRVTSQYVYSDQCYFTVTNSSIVPENACLSARICGQRSMKNLPEPVTINFKGVFNNSQNYENPTVDCVWWETFSNGSGHFVNSGMEVVNFTESLGQNVWKTVKTLKLLKTRKKSEKREQHEK